MTATHTAPYGFPHNILALFRRAGNLAIKGLLALTIVFMAGMIAVATAVAGLALAAFAVVLRLTGSREDAPNTRYEESAENGAITLEAKRTPRGWTVE